MELEGKLDGAIRTPAYAVIGHIAIELISLAFDYTLQIVGGKAFARDYTKSSTLLYTTYTLQLTLCTPFISYSVVISHYL